MTGLFYGNMFLVLMTVLSDGRTLGRMNRLIGEEGTPRFDDV